jgi:hypothetical protein
VEVNPTRRLLESRQLVHPSTRHRRTCTNPVRATTSPALGCPRPSGAIGRIDPQDEAQDTAVGTAPVLILRAQLSGRWLSRLEAFSAAADSGRKVDEEPVRHDSRAAVEAYRWLWEGRYE